LVARPDYLRAGPVENHSPGARGSAKLFIATSRFQPLVLICLDVVLLLRAPKNLSGIFRVIRLNEQVKRPQATRDRRKHRFSTFN
jgi:hypothetical protein